MRRRCILLFAALVLLALCSGAFGADYFVATTGSDGNPGTIALPWLTINYAIQHVAAGDTINVRAGSYARVYWDYSYPQGAPGATITLQAYDGDRTVYVSEAGGSANAFAVDGCRYLRIVGLDISGGYYCAWVNAPAHHVEFYHCYFHDSITGDAVKGTSIPSDPASYLSVVECEIARPGGTAPSGNNQCIDHVNIDYALFRNNYMHDFPDMAFYTKGGSKYVVAEGNVLYNASVTSAGPAVGFGQDTGQESMAIGATFQSYYMVMRNNIFSYCTGGVVGTYDCYHGYFYNNLTHNCGSGYLALVFQRTSTNRWTPATEGFYVFNNIFLDTRGQMPSWVYRDHSGSYSDFQHDYNNYYNNGSPIPTGGMFNPLLEANSTFGNPNLSLSGGTPTTWQGWVDYFRPTAASTLIIDEGTSAAGTLFVPAVVRDIEDHGRPQGAGWDIGPYEYPGTAVTPVANFLAVPVYGLTPFRVEFTDYSSGGPTSWSWSFGDSGTSTLRNPVHTYTAAGSYTVTLTAANGAGSDGETKTNCVTAVTPQDYTCASSTVNNGTLQSGTHTSVHASDNVYQVVKSAKVANKQVTQVTYSFSTGLSSLFYLGFTVESNASAGAPPLTVYVYNYSTSTWDSKATSTLGTTDTTVAALVANPASYISGGTVQVRVKAGGTSTTVFNHSTDLVKITAAP